MLTVVEYLQNRELIDQAGGDAYVYALADQAPAGGNVSAYASIIHDKAVLRSLQQVATKVVDSVYHPEGRTPDELLQQAEADIFSISNTRGRQSAMEPIGNILAKTTDGLIGCITLDKQ